MDKKKKGKIQWQALLIALAVTLVLLGAVVGFQFWLTDAVHKSLEAGAFWRGNIIGDLVGGLCVFCLVYRFVRGPKEKDR